ncbi:MAG: pseudaminic acid cytidylyltransferase [Bacteroidota bacterium]
MSSIAIIPARGGSKRIPGKNIKNFFGKPIIAYSIEAAIGSGLFDEVMVSTDVPEIAEIAKKYGAKVPFLRSSKNSDDFANTAVVIEEVLKEYAAQNMVFDTFCCIYPTCPLIEIKKIILAYQCLISEKFNSVISVVIFNSPVQRAFVADNNKIKMVWSENYAIRSQDLEQMYYDAGQFYWMFTDKFFLENKLFTSNTGYIELDEFETQDINTNFDWLKAEYKFELLQKKKNRNNKIVLGTAQFGLKYGINNAAGKLNKEQIKFVLDYAFENKIQLLDTAEAYGDSQEAIGEYHKLSGNKFDIITKFSSGRTDLSQNLTTRIHQDLKSLNVDTIYCYMFHSFSDFKTYFDGYKNEIKELKKSGIVKKFGVSIYTNQEAEELLKYDSVDVIQLPFNLLDNNTKRSIIIKQAKDKGVEIHTRSTFLQGLFFKNVESLPVKLMVLEPYLNRINHVSENNFLSLNDLSLSYVLQQKNIDNVLIGVDSVDQLKKNMQSLKKGISEEVVKQIDQIDVKEIALLNPSNWNQ